MVPKFLMGYNETKRSVAASLDQLQVGPGLRAPLLAARSAYDLATPRHLLMPALSPPAAQLHRPDDDPPPRGRQRRLAPARRGHERLSCRFGISRESCCQRHQSDVAAAALRADRPNMDHVPRRNVARADRAQGRREDPGGRGIKLDGGRSAAV